MNVIKDWAERHNYECSLVKSPIESGELKKNLSEIDYQFVQDHKLDEKSVEELLKKSHFLNCRKLLSVCVCIIATKFYVSNEVEAITNKMKELGV